MLFLLVIKIFFARIIDVSLGTYKTILTVKGKIIFPSIIAFFEVLVWFYIAREALVVYEKSIVVPIAYSLGYAIGNLIGSIISKKFIEGVLEVKVYNANKNVIGFLNKHKIRYFRENNIVVFYIFKRKDEVIMKRIHEISKKCIIYTKEVNLIKNRLNKREYLH